MVKYASKNIKIKTICCRCKNVKFSDDLPTATVIICFYNEHYHTLLRTIHSVINRTPHSLLKEIILINDHSDIEHLQEDLEGYFKNNFKNIVKLYKTDKREGLIRARIIGAHKATGQVM